MKSTSTTAGLISDRSVRNIIEEAGTPMDISGTIALVTGANRGLGRAIAEDCSSRGARRCTPPCATSSP